MQACVDWVLKIFETQVIEKKRPARSVFPDDLSVSCDWFNHFFKAAASFGGDDTEKAGRPLSAKTSAIASIIVEVVIESAVNTDLMLMEEGTNSFC